MPRLPPWASWWRNLVHRDRVERDLDDELQAAFDLFVAEHAAAGLSRDEARRGAALHFGGVEVLKERVRDLRQGAAADVLIRDVRYALRLLRRSPGFTAVALITLALGIGANTTMFTIVHGVLLRPLPYPDADSLVRLYLANAEQGIPDGMVSPPDFDVWQSHVQSARSMGAYQIVPVILTGRGEPVEVHMAFTRGRFFETLGTPAVLGRTLAADDMQRAPPYVVISERLWRTRFGADPAIVGHTIPMMRRAFTIVGVMPAAFRYPTAETEAWAPRSVLNEMEIGPDNRNQRVLESIARLREGVSADQARAELSAVAARLAVEFPETNKGWNAADVIPLRTTIVGSVDTALRVVLAMVGVTLLIGCLNLANLMLARGPARATEIAIRTALGAGRTSIVRQVLTESIALALLGGALGIVLSFWGVQAILALSADTLPRVEDVRVDGRIIGFGVLLAVLTGSLFGLVPALRAATADPNLHLRGGRTTLGRGHRLRNALVIAEVTLAVVLVIGAGLMARSFVALRSVDPGFDPDRVLATTIMINPEGTKDVVEHIVQRRRAFIERARALPGVTAAGAVNSLPLESDLWEWFEFTRADGTGMPDGSKLRADRTYIDGEYLQAMGIPLLRGEYLPANRRQLTRGAPIPFLVSETAARRFWPNQEPVGQIVRAPWQGVVVGVVGDVRLHGLAEAPGPAVYFPHFVGPRIVTTIVARTDGDPAALAGALREAIRQIDPNQPIRSIAPLRDVMAESIARDRFFTIVIALFGGLSLVLATVGVYGVLAYAVGQRTAEIGLRLALGARAADVFGMILGGGMRLVAAGVVLGAAASLVVTRTLQSQLYAITATDPTTFAVASVAMVLVSLAACLIPAHRAMRIEPVAALREE